MKNVIFIIVDSLSEDRIEEISISKLMPFTSSLSKKTTYYKNFFSQGPYTEAGTKSLLCGSNSLESYGYLFRFDKSENFITKTFKTFGYKTHNLIYPTCLLSNWIINTNDVIYHTSHFMFNVLWDQKFSYYYSLLKKNDFDDTDMDDCVHMLEICFECWLKFLKDCVKNEKEVLLIKNNISIEKSKECFMELSNEYNLFLKDKIEYTAHFLNSQGKHKLNKISSPLIGDYTNSKVLSQVWANRREDINFLVKTHFKYNLKNNHITKRFIRDMFIRIKMKEFDKYIFGEIPNLIHHINKGKEIKKLYSSNKPFVNMVSAEKQFSLIPQILEDSEEPVFIMSHIEEPHNYCTFFTYDSESEEILNNEIDYAVDFAKNVDKKYKGLLAYDLSVRYVDECLKRLYSELENKNLLDNTIICITGDHGTSYNVNPPRNRNVVNFYKENYRVPLIIIDPNQKEQVINENFYDNSKFLEILKSFSVNSNILVEQKGYALVEFMGAGCPDLRRRPVWLSIFTKEYCVCFKQTLNKPFSEKSINFIFDLINDKKETKNIYKIRNDKINHIIEIIKTRFIELQEKYINYVRK